MPTAVFLLGFVRHALKVDSGLFGCSIRLAIILLPGE
jgi:hypothetical protein